LVEFIGAVLLEPSLTESAVGNDRASRHGEAADGLNECRADVVLGPELLLGGESMGGMQK
jgi:hypothetical protein